jgi:hypothetical protein
MGTDSYYVNFLELCKATCTSGNFLAHFAQANETLSAIFKASIKSCA